MRRWLLALLLLALPLQWSWAVAAPYCSHEQVEAPAAHPGHHTHAHAGGERAAQAKPQPPGDQPASADDADCIACHGGALHGAAPALSGPAPAAGQPYPAPSALAFAERHLQEIDRPKWREAA